jgi:hypothetical protein
LIFDDKLGFDREFDVDELDLEDFDLVSVDSGATKSAEFAFPIS